MRSKFHQEILPWMQAQIQPHFLSNSYTPNNPNTDRWHIPSGNDYLQAVIHNVPLFLSTLKTMTTHPTDGEKEIALHINTNGSMNIFTSYADNTIFPGQEYAAIKLHTHISTNEMFNRNPGHTHFSAGDIQSMTRAKLTDQKARTDHGKGFSHGTRFLLGTTIQQETSLTELYYSPLIEAIPFKDIRSLFKHNLSQYIDFLTIYMGRKEHKLQDITPEVYFHPIN